MQAAPPVVISGKVLTYEGAPAADRQIHLENTVTADAYLTSTGKDGSFSIAVPPAYYNLREEHGPIVAGNIWAQGDAISLGTVSEPAALQRSPAKRGHRAGANSQSGADNFRCPARQPDRTRQPDFA